MKRINIESLADDYNSGIRINNDLYIYQGTGEIGMETMHRIDVLGICIPMTGEYGIEVNGINYTLQPGQIMICHTNDLYRNVIFSEDFYGTLIFASLDLVSGIVDNLLLQRGLSILGFCPVVRIEDGHFRMIEQFCELIDTHLPLITPSSGRESTLLICRALIADLFEVIIDNKDFSGFTDGMNRSQQIFHDFLNLLSSTPIKPHDMEYYADKLHIRGKYLSAIAKKESGRTAGEWIKEYIMNDVRRYLKGTDYSIKEISSILGYSNFPFFCKSVKKHFGKTPLEIRNERDK